MELARSDDAAMRIARRALGTFALVGTTAVVWFAFVNPAGAHTPTVKATCVRGQAVLVVELRNYSDRAANYIGIEDGTTRLEAKKFSRDYQGMWARPGETAHEFKIAVRASDDLTGDRGFSFAKTVRLPACEQAATKLPITTKPPILEPVPTTTTEPSTSRTEHTTTTTTPSSSHPLLPPALPPAQDKNKETTSVGSATPPSSETATATPVTTTTTTTSRTTPSFPVGTSTSRATIIAIGNGSNLPNTGASIAIPLLVGLCLVTAGGVVMVSMRTPRKRGRHAA